MKQLKRLLVPIDFSPGSARALARAARLAAAHGAALELLHVVDREPLQYLLRLVPGLQMRPESELIADAEGRLRDVARSLERDASQTVSMQVRAGVPYLEIAACAEAIRPDLIVIGAHGAHEQGGELTGATAQKVARSVHGSVLMVRGEARRDYELILVAVDITTPSRDALEASARMGPRASIYVLHAYEPVFEGMAYFADASKEALADCRRTIERELREHLDKLVGEAELGNAVTTRLLRRGHARRAIKEAADELGVDLVVLNARERSAASRFFLGSVSAHVMIEAPSDVLLVR